MSEQRLIDANALKKAIKRLYFSIDEVILDRLFVEIADTLLNVKIATLP